MATDGERNILVYLVIAAALVLVIGFFAVLLPQITGDGQVAAGQPEPDEQQPPAGGDGDEEAPPQDGPGEQGSDEAGGDGEEEAAEADDRPAQEAAPPEGGVGRYVIQPGDTFFDLTRRFWGDPDLWPGLYAVNSEAVSNPDLIYPGQVISLLADTQSTDDMTTQERLSLAAGHVETYRAYINSAESVARESSRGRQLVNAAHWVLYSAVGFDDQVLERYSDEIRESDREIVESYLERFGPPQR